MELLGGRLHATSRTSCLGCRNRIAGVTLSPGSSCGPVGTRCLDHRRTGQLQVLCSASAVAAGGFDSHAQQPAVRSEPEEHRPVADPCRGERFGAEQPAFGNHGDSGVQVLVGIDAPADPGAFCWHPRHLGPLHLRLVRGVEPSSADVGHDSERTYWVRLCLGHDVDRGPSSTCRRWADRQKLPSVFESCDPEETGS